MGETSGTETSFANSVPPTIPLEMQGLGIGQTASEGKGKV
jgi:hypothetical protein